MKPTIVIVVPFSSGALLAPHFIRNGFDLDKIETLDSQQSLIQLVNEVKQSS